MVIENGLVTFYKDFLNFYRERKTKNYVKGGKQGNPNLNLCGDDGDGDPLT